MSEPYRPSDETIGFAFLGALIGIAGGAILGKSIGFFIGGMLVLFGVVYAVVKGDSNEPDGQDQSERPRNRNQ